MGKSTISMAIFNSYVSLPEGKCVPNGSPMFPTSAVASATSATASHPQIPIGGSMMEALTDRGTGEKNGYFFSSCDFYPLKMVILPIKNGD